MDLPSVTPWQFVSRKLTSWLLEHIEYQLVSRDSPCDCCAAKPDTWPTPCKAAVVKDGYGRELHICEDCIPLYQSNADVMGVERAAGNSGGVVPNKFGMLASVLVVVDQAGVTLMAPKKIADKLPSSFPVNTYEYPSLSDAYQRIYTRDWQYPAVFITDLGKKKGELVRNLRFSYSAEKAFLCTAENVSPLNLGAIKECLNIASSMDKKARTLAIKLMRDAPNGRITPKNMALAIKDQPNVKSLLIAATTDPVMRIAVAQAMKNV
ncbi:hypothetical protein [Thalassolituus marinus]|uniref:Uncharacterized protein n=1 Tax=Thalassolituus marinus TaxID=671053 RepID=A0ABS7ZUC2_9GAMM|nr:hypothetical protein [Thalassolituus marinus]MCA6065347.1 hypothetical protein [Thalassolituus marinus]